MQKTTPSLMLCIILDAVGMFSYALPFFGELADIVWAPLSALIFFLLFGRKRFGLNGAVFSFVEELLPGFDFIPTFTIAWIIKMVRSKLNVDRFSAT